MHRNRTWTLGVAVAATLVPTAPATAQEAFLVRADLELATRYVWRGLSSGRPEVTFGLLGSRSGRSSYTSAGIWTLGLPVGLNEPQSNRQGATGTMVPLENELDVWVEHARALGPFRIAFGGTYYIYNDFIFDADDPNAIPNTVELYGRAEHRGLVLGDLQLAPKVAVWHDVHHVRGTYLETSLTGRLPAWANSGVYLGVLTGWSLGQSVNGDQGAYFATDGLTHADFSITLPWIEVKSVAYTAAFHYQINVDDFTRMTSQCEACDGQTVWINLVISYTL